MRKEIEDPSLQFRLGFAWPAFGGAAGLGVFFNAVQALLGIAPMNGNIEENPFSNLGIDVLGLGFIAWSWYGDIQKNDAILKRIQIGQTIAGLEVQPVDVSGGLAGPRITMNDM